LRALRWQTLGMRSRLALSVVAAALAVSAVACSNSPAKANPTVGTSKPIAGSSVPQSSVAPTTVRPTTAASTSTTTTTLAEETTTSTTLPESAKIVIGADRVGDALLGTDPDSVITYLTSILGKPTADSGWADPNSAFGVCPGTEVRGVVWGDLTLLFSDESNVAAGRRHFFYYSYGPAFGAQVNPFGMHTEAGITVGSPLKQLKAAYPSVVVYTDEPAGVTFSIDDTFTGSLSGPGANAVVTNINGGVGCGE